MEQEPHRFSAEELYVFTTIDQALLEQNEVPDDVARILAGWHHGGQGSAFYSFASSGAIDCNGLKNEFIKIYNEPGATDRTKLELHMLGLYWVYAPGIDEHGDRPPVPGWHAATKAPDYRQDS